VHLLRLCLKTPSSARDRALFRLAKLVPSEAEGTEAGDIGFIVDGAPDVHRDSQVENEQREAKSSSQTEPNAGHTNSVQGLCVSSIRARWLGRCLCSL